MIKTFCDRCERAIKTHRPIAKNIGALKVEVFNQPFDAGTIAAYVGMGTDYILCEGCNGELKAAIKGFMAYDR